MTIMLIDFFTDPFQYQFMQLAFAQVFIISVLAGIVGTYIIIRNLAFITDALGHGVFPGVVLAIILNVNILIGALFASLLTILGITYISNDRKISENTSVGIFFTSMFAVGILLVSTLDSFKSNLSDLLVGEILGVSLSDVVLTLVVALIVIILTFSYFRKIVLVSFDRQYARAIGFNVALIDFLTYLMISLAVVVSIQAIGVLLIMAITIIPAATSRLISKNVLPMMLYSILFSLIGSIVGLYVSFYIEIAATSATIVLVNSAIFALIYGYKRYL